MQIENNLTLINSILTNGNSILLSADGVWGISCNALEPSSVKRLLDQATKTGTFIAEVLVSDLEMLKKYTTDLHPRMETLLLYHERPIRIKCKQDKVIKSGLNGNASYFRIVKDTPCRILINEFRHPILMISFLQEDKRTQVPKNEIRLDNFKNLQFIASKIEESNDKVPPMIKVSFNEEGLIQVLE